MHRSSGSLVAAECQSKSAHLDRYVAGTWPRINRLFWATGLSFKNRTISWSLTATVFRSTDGQNQYGLQELVSIACQLTYLVTKGKALGKNDSNCQPIHHWYSSNNSPNYILPTLPMLSRPTVGRSVHGYSTNRKTPLGRYSVNCGPRVNQASANREADISIHSGPRYRPIHRSTVPQKIHDLIILWGLIQSILLFLR